MNLKNTIWVIFLFLIFCSCQTKQSNPLDTWEAGSANDDVFVEMTQDDLNDMVRNGLGYLEVDWYVGVYRYKDDRDQLADWAKGIKERADKAGITIWSAHLPFNTQYDISTVDETIRREAVGKNIADMVLSANTIAPRYFVLHPSLEPISDEERPLRMEACRKSLQVLARKARELNAVLLVENLPRTCLANTSAEINYLIDSIDNIGICFDVNHLLKESHVSFVRNTAGKIKSTHMSDYDFIDEKHWLPGEGDIHWNELFTELIRSGYNGPFIFEPTCRELPYAPSIQAMGDRWKQLKQNYADNNGKLENRALYLDGKNNNIAIGMGIIESPWTLEAWIKANDTDRKEEEVIFGGGEYSTVEGIDNMPLVIRNGKLHNAFAGLWSDTVLDDQWHHVAISSDRHTTKLYVDGNVVDSKPVSFPVLVGSLGVQEDTASVFGGLMDEVRIWTTDLGEETVKEWMGLPVRPSHPHFSDLRGYYNFDEGIDDSALNWTGKGQQAYHIRNYRVNYRQKTPLAYTVPNDNTFFSYNPMEKQEIFNAVTINSEWDSDRGSTDEQVVKLRIIVTGVKGTLTLSELELDLSGTTNTEDISAIHIYEAGKKARIDRKTEIFGNGTSPGQRITLKNGNVRLTPGVNYLLVTADIAENATAGNTIRINIPSFKVNGKAYRPETSDDLNDKKITVNSRENTSVFRVLDWNIWHGGNHLGNDGPGKVIELIKAANADIVTMQEAYGSQERIASTLGYQLQTQAPDQNLALYSRYPVTPLQPTEAFKSNPAIVTLPGGKEILVNSCWLRYAYNPEYTANYPEPGHNTDLWVAEDSIRPMADMRVILSKDTYTYAKEDMPVIIAGDFNSCSHLDWTKRAAPLHYGYGPVNFPTSRFMIENGFKDSFREMHPNEVARPEGTFAAIYGHLQTGRIDFVYYRPGKIKALSSKIIRTAPEIDDVWASDHSAVVTTFEYTGGN